MNMNIDEYDTCVMLQASTLMAVNGDAFTMSALAGRSNGTSWVEFCEHHATVAAEDFSLHVAQFLQDGTATDRQVSRRDFVNKFVDCFQRHFDSIQVLHHMYAYSMILESRFCL